MWTTQKRKKKWTCRRTVNIKWFDKDKNEKVLSRMGEERRLLGTIEK